jgi:hypothetical protein
LQRTFAQELAARESSRTDTELPVHRELSVPRRTARQKWCSNMSAGLGSMHGTATELPAFCTVQGNVYIQIESQAIINRLS